ncbi:DNA methyltransferase [Kocuria sp.]|uniref:DNA methyltransferase n=1 Tax=Kocuria sp. TaxID=1871328 RepID=UPI0026DEC19B|nr:DNA methyltransferase [Kocuria sp.]MDO5619649.1 DNA methyltransferase [Kocuria sp.]
MSRLTDLLAQAKAKDPTLGADLEAEIRVLQERRPFGLNFERHQPEAVELPGRPVRKGDKVRVLPPRETTTRGDQRLWRVTRVETVDEDRIAHVELTGPDGASETQVVSVEDIVVVAEFRDPIYPGLVSTGRVERGGPDKPFHTVINAENYHALQTLLYTHRGQVDCIYIDPPYNSGAKDWKYNNDYVDGEDLYRHSKWLAFMERRLLLARELLDPTDSVLIVAIDEREFARLSLLIDQTFPGARVQMVSTLINPKGVSRGGFRRADEYLFFVMLGAAVPARLPLSREWSPSPKAAYGSDTVAAVDEEGTDNRRREPGWSSMMRRGSNSARKDRPTMFYPIYSDPEGRQIKYVGEPIPEGERVAPRIEGLVPILPLRRNGSEGRWQVGADELRTRIGQGRVRLGRKTDYGFVVNYLSDGAYAEVMSDRYQIEGRAADGSLVAWSLPSEGEDERVAPTQWKVTSHNASEYGSTLLSAFIPGRSFPFPKSLYAVEDSLRFFVSHKPNATVLDFFAGSGTTAHAVMRLNHADGGRRQAIVITNNEVSSDEQAGLRKKGLRPGDEAWERLGICDYVTKPRIRAAVTGETHDGKPVKGDYKFIDEFPLSEGFEENVEFFDLTYESPWRVARNRDFAMVAPLLWLRAGSRGRRIDSVPEEGWDVADTYGVLVNLDAAKDFTRTVSDAEVGLVFVVTDDDRRFQMVAKSLPETVNVVRLYESYLRNFEINTGRR